MPQTEGVEINTGILYSGKPVYAQRFIGSNISITANTRKEVQLMSGGVDDILAQMGWVQPNVGSAKGIIGTTFLGTTGSAINTTGGHYLSKSVTDNSLVLRIAFNGNGSASYDLVIFYTKVS